MLASEEVDGCKSKPMYVLGDVKFEAAMGLFTQGGALLLERWLEWQERFCPADGPGNECH